MLPEPDSRRNFVKKSLAASIAAAQPTFFAGLVRATGGGETTSLPETTWVYDSTYPWTETTVLWPDTTVPLPTVPDGTYDTTVPETTVPETTISETTTVKWYRKEFEWGVVITSHPKNSNGQFTNWGNSSVAIHDSSNHAHVGSLWVHAVATVHPPQSMTLTASQQGGEIPPEKVQNEFRFKEKGRANYDGNPIAFLHPNDAYVPGPGNTNFSSTVEVQMRPKYSARNTKPWKEGDEIPDDPTAPTVFSEPESDSAKSISPTGGAVKLLGEWSPSGWTWVAALASPNNMTWDITHVGNWAPGNLEGKTNNVVLLWTVVIAQRSRIVYREDGEPNSNFDWKPVDPLESDPEGWSPWTL